MVESLILRLIPIDQPASVGRISRRRNPPFCARGGGLRLALALLAVHSLHPLTSPARLQRLAVVLVVRLHELREASRIQIEDRQRDTFRYCALLASQRRMSRKSKSFPRLRRWRRGARWARRKLARAPRAARIVGVVAILLVLVALTNLVYQVIRKPTELFAFGLR